MAALLRWLSRRRPWQVLAAVIAISVVGAPLDASVTHPLLQSLSFALAAAVMFGYPLLVIFGFPAPYSTLSRRRVALGSVAVLCLICLATAMAPAALLAPPTWQRVVIGIPLVAMVYAPFFVATSIVDDAHRSLGQYQFGDCVGTWLCIFSYPLFGVFFVNRRVASVLDTLDARARPTHGGAIAV
jgi:hypothetical protein